MVGLFVANNVDHEQAHTYIGELGSESTEQLECDTCHVFEGKLLSHYNITPSHDLSDEQIVSEPVSAALAFQYSPYLSRAPPGFNI